MRLATPRCQQLSKPSPFYHPGLGRLINAGITNVPESALYAHVQATPTDASGFHRPVADHRDVADQNFELTGIQKWLAGAICERRSGLIDAPSGDVPIAFSPPDAPQVDAAEQQRQLGGPQRGAGGVGIHGRQLEGPLFEPLLPDRRAVGVEVQPLHAVAPPVDEDVQPTPQRIAAEVLLGHAQ